jgi:ERCC4-related helicase
VALCEQQYGVFKSHLPAYNIIFLSGKDNVDHWTDHGIWDAVLSDVRVVLSTHQVLLDALTHAFVKMSKIAMLVFDEGTGTIIQRTRRSKLIIIQPITAYQTILRTV